MSFIDFVSAEKEITSVIQEVCDILQIEENINTDFVPGNCIMSQVLISITSQIEVRLGIEIKDNCYLFYDSKNKVLLSIKNATKKLILLLENEKQYIIRKRANS